jgi:uncharacterized protein (TIGR02391 family)
MLVDLHNILHEQIISGCLQLYKEKHYKHAAFDAMTIIEKTLKDKTDVDIKSAVGLVKNIFGGEKGLKLCVPFGDDFQIAASRLFQGAFSYYRNYAAHDGTRINSNQCLRILILASELLDLIDASGFNYEPLKKLIDTGVFRNDESAIKLLKLLDGYTTIEDVYDGLFELLAKNGFSSEQMESLIEIKLLTFESTEANTIDSFEDELDGEELYCFRLTAIGKGILKGISPV